MRRWILATSLIYLAFSTLAWENDGQGPGRYMVYGWVAVDANGGDVVVTESARDADGGAMIVGGGAIPEPNTAILTCALLTYGTGDSGSGPFVTFYWKRIQAVMDFLCPGYTLQEFDFSNFRRLDDVH